LFILKEELCLFDRKIYKFFFNANTIIKPVLIKSYFWTLVYKYCNNAHMYYVIL
jgi:hypothetical protein